MFMKNRKKANKKGFTLIELLAVIVVLAIIMILAVPNIIESMNKAKKKSFQMYGEKMFNSALQEYESRKMLNEAISPHVFAYDSSGNKEYCYTFEDIGINSPGNYKGFVRVNHRTTTTGGKSDTTYQIYLTDDAYLYNGTFSNDVQNKIDSILNIDCDKSSNEACLSLSEATELMKKCTEGTK